MRFLEDRGSTFSKAEVIEEEEDPTEGPNLFNWGIVIVVLLGLNIGSWTFCNMVFGHPDHPFSYGLLTKMNKLEPLEGFKSNNVPGGKFRTPKFLYTEIYSFDKSELRAHNGRLMRNYLWNYKDRNPVTFIFGSFTVDEVRPLNEEDVFPMGISITGTAYKFPDAKVKLVLPTATPVQVADQYKVGESFTIEKASVGAAVINAERTGPDDPVTFTAVPLITKGANEEDLPFKTPSGDNLILRTPEWLNVQ